MRDVVSFFLDYAAGSFIVLAVITTVSQYGIARMVVMPDLVIAVSAIVIAGAAICVSVLAIRRSRRYLGGQVCGPRPDDDSLLIVQPPADCVHGGLCDGRWEWAREETRTAVGVMERREMRWVCADA